MNSCQHVVFRFHREKGPITKIFEFKNVNIFLFVNFNI